jgi:proteasome alpha subunit
VSMPFYVSPEQIMRDKADYARSRIARYAAAAAALQYAGGILLVAPNRSTALHKISELYDRIAFAAAGRYNEYEALRKAGVTYADVTGYQFDRRDVTARALANWYAQTLGGIFTDSTKPYEVEIVVAEVGITPDNDQIYRITFDGSVSDEPGFVAFGGQSDVVTAALKERFHDGMSLAEALGAALAALAAPAAQGNSGASAGNGAQAELTASQLEVAILDRARAHRKFRRLRGPRLEELLAETRAASGSDSAPAPAPASGSTPASGSAAASGGDSGSGSAPGSGGDSGSGSAPGSGGDSGSGSAPGSGGDSGPGSAASSATPTPEAPKTPQTPPDEPPTGPAPGSGDGIPRPPAGN